MEEGSEEREVGERRKGKENQGRTVGRIMRMEGRKMEVYRKDGRMNKGRKGGKERWKEGINASGEGEKKEGWR